MSADEQYRTHGTGAGDVESGEDGREITVGLVADPGLPATVADLLADRLCGALPDHLDEQPVTWRATVTRDPFEVLVPDYERMLDKARQRVVSTSSDIAVCVTDTPLRDGRNVIAAQVGSGDPIVLVSLPALGGLAPARRTYRLVSVLVEHVASDLVAPDRERPRLRLPRGVRGFPGLRVTGSAEQGVSSRVTVAGPFGIARLVAGMVRANRPWRMAWALSGAMGGALAGSSFGILYSSLWNLADSLPTWRLLGMAVCAVGVHVAWIVFGHRLWERGRRSSRRDRPSVGLRNATTVLTVGFGILVFTAELFVLTWAASLLVVTPEYLASVLGHPVGYLDHVQVALMSTVMGTIAGAVGSGWEDAVTVREATYAQRQRERENWE